ncbi:hypothetical protein HDZ31DRAFT_84292 [Schizophyllum fasciatum]
MSAVARCPICFQCKDISKFLFHRCDERRPECAICRERKQYPPHPIFVKFEDPDASLSVDVSQLANAIDTRSDIDNAYSLEHLGRRMHAATSSAGASEAAINALREASDRLALRLPVLQDLEIARDRTRELEERKQNLERRLAAEQTARTHSSHESERLSRRNAELQEQTRAAEQRAMHYQHAAEDAKTDLDNSKAKNERLLRKIEKLEEEVRTQEKDIRAKDKELAAMGSELTVTKKKMRGMARQSKKQSTSKTPEDDSLVVI